LSGGLQKGRRSLNIVREDNWTNSCDTERRCTNEQSNYSSSTRASASPHPQPSLPFQPLQPASSLPLHFRRLRHTAPAAAATPRPATPASSARTTSAARNSQRILANLGSVQRRRRTKQRRNSTATAAAWWTSWTCWRARSALHHRDRSTAPAASRVRDAIPKEDEATPSSPTDRGDSFQLTQRPMHRVNEFGRPLPLVYPRVRAAVFAFLSRLLLWLLLSTSSARPGRYAPSLVAARRSPVCAGTSDNQCR
jgi:hypothetical protein